MDKFFKDLKNRLKKLFKNFKDMLNDPDKRKNIFILGIIIIFIIVVIVIYLVTSKNISSIERKELMSKSDDFKYYLEYIDDNKLSNDYYILFTLKYSQENNTRSILSCDEISEFLKSKFNKDIKPEDIRNTGITELLLNEDVVYNPGDDTYEISISRKQPLDIAETGVSYYKVKKVSKVNKKKYNIVYQKYYIDNPYNVLNYYIDKNNQVNNTIDISPYRNYLSGSTSVFSFKNSINPDDIENYSKKDYKIKVTYIVKDDNLLIDKVSRCKLC